MSSADGKRYMGRVAALGCAICRRLGHGITPACVHHQRTGIGMGKRASDFNVIPLCHEHHQGMTGIHGMGRKAFERLYGVTEVDLVAETKDLLGRVES